MRYSRHCESSTGRDRLSIWLFGPLIKELSMKSCSCCLPRIILGQKAADSGTWGELVSKTLFWAFWASLGLAHAKEAHKDTTIGRLSTLSFRVDREQSVKESQARNIAMRRYQMSSSGLCTCAKCAHQDSDPTLRTRVVIGCGCSCASTWVYHASSARRPISEPMSHALVEFEYCCARCYMVLSS